ncbi:hypothetical protein NC651_029933 [Populus alba x Populus x berolinensis]|nr:hypothetical protein NC651_029933 [Populus alba x Populus x berolinensis]
MATTSDRSSNQELTLLSFQSPSCCALFSPSSWPSGTRRSGRDADKNTSSKMFVLMALIT